MPSDGIMDVVTHSACALDEDSTTKEERESRMMISPSPELSSVSYYRPTDLNCYDYLLGRALQDILSVFARLGLQDDAEVAPEEFFQNAEEWMNILNCSFSTYSSDQPKGSKELPLVTPHPENLMRQYTFDIMSAFIPTSSQPGFHYEFTPNEGNILPEECPLWRAADILEHKLGNLITKNNVFFDILINVKFQLFLDHFSSYRTAFQEEFPDALKLFISQVFTSLKCERELSSLVDLTDEERSYLRKLLKLRLKVMDNLQLDGGSRFAGSALKACGSLFAFLHSLTQSIAPPLLQQLERQGDLPCAVALLKQSALTVRQGNETVISEEHLRLFYADLGYNDWQKYIGNLGFDISHLVAVFHRNVKPTANSGITPIVITSPQCRSDISTGSWDNALHFGNRRGKENSVPPDNGSTSDVEPNSISVETKNSPEQASLIPSSSTSMPKRKAKIDAKKGKGAESSVKPKKIRKVAVPWSREDTDVLLIAVREQGPKWSYIEKHYQFSVPRDQHEIRSRFRVLEKNG